jgi:hypothetical protein
MTPRCDAGARTSTATRRTGANRRRTAPGADATNAAAVQSRDSPRGCRVEQNDASPHAPAGIATMTAPTVTDFNRMGADCLPGHLGIAITHADATEVRAEMGVTMALMAPNCTQMILWPQSA